MNTRRIIAFLLVLCLILGLPSTSMAAKKKSAREKSSSGDAVAQILKKYKPLNKTNTQIIRNAINKYKRDQILIITWDESGGIINFELISSKNGARVVKADAGLGDFPYSYWEKMEKGCVFMNSGIALRFYDTKGNYDVFSNEAFEGRSVYDVMDALEDKGDFYPEDYIPYILQYTNDGI